MKEKKTKEIILSTGKELAQQEGRTSPIIERISRDVVTRARAQGLSQARFRLGNYLLREPDYQQILLWAEDMEMSPAEVLQHLSNARHMDQDLELGFAVENDAIVSMVWDFVDLPVAPYIWMKGLQIRKLIFIGQCPESYDWKEGLLIRRLKFTPTILSTTSALLPRLTGLWCSGNQLSELDLAAVPGLIRLHCNANLLTELDLAPVPGLTELVCHANKLTELDLSPVPGLTGLGCSSNQLTELDLSPVPGLTELWCQWNQLTELDLSPVPGLTRLHCSGNLLTELDLVPVPGLTKLNCFDNQLTELDFSSVPGLTELWCQWNQLTELDLSPVPGLTTLRCTKGVRLINAPRDLNVHWFAAS